MQLSILTSILRSRVQYAAQSRVLGQVQQQQQINSVRYTVIIIRGGVEDSRLEAKTKAKDTKKSEAKAKDRNARGQG